VFTEHEGVRRKHGATGHALLRATDDPNTLVIVTEFATADGAQAFMADPTLAEAMSRGGVDSQPGVWLWDGAGVDGAVVIGPPSRATTSRKGS